MQIVTTVCPQTSIILSKRKIGAAKAERFLMLLFSSSRSTNAAPLQEKLEY